MPESLHLTLRKAFGISQAQSNIAQQAFHVIQYLFIGIVLLTILSSIALLFMENKEERKTLLRTLIGLNAGIVFPTIIISTIKLLFLERRWPWRHYIGMLCTLVMLIIVNPATYLSIAYYLEDRPEYVTIERGLFVGTVILPVLTLPYYFIMMLWFNVSNFSYSD